MWYVLLAGTIHKVSLAHSVMSNQKVLLLDNHVLHDSGRCADQREHFQRQLLRLVPLQRLLLRNQVRGPRVFAAHQPTALRRPLLHLPKEEHSEQ